jgi:hypothetical protein
MCAWHIPEASRRNTKPRNQTPKRKKTSKTGTGGWTPALDAVPEEEDDGMKTPDPIKTSKTSPPLEKKVRYKRRREHESTDPIKTSKKDESMQKQKVKGTPGFM